MRQAILDAAKLCQISVSELTPDTRESFRNQVIEKFAPGADRNRWLWDYLTTQYGSASVFGAQSWRLMADFMKDQPIYLFFSEDHEAAIFKFTNGNEVIQTLSTVTEIFSEFYLVDPSLNFLIGYDHEKSLYARGTAADWLNQRCTEIYRRLSIEPDTLFVSKIQMREWGFEIILDCLYGTHSERTFQLLFRGCVVQHWKARPSSEVEISKIHYIFLNSGEGNFASFVSIRSDHFTIDMNFDELITSLI